MPPDSGPDFEVPYLPGDRRHARQSGFVFTTPNSPGSGGTVGLVIDGVAGAIAVVVGTVD